MSSKKRLLKIIYGILSSCFFKKDDKKINNKLRKNICTLSYKRIVSLTREKLLQINSSKKKNQKGKEYEKVCVYVYIFAQLSKDHNL